MILCDSGALIALADRSDKHHKTVSAFASADFLIPSTVLCEVDYFLTKYLGEEVAKTFLEEVTDSNELLVFDAIDLAQVNRIRRQYNDLPLGFVDASVIALADRYRIQQILTIDRRHFLAVKSIHFGYFELLP